MSLDGASVLLVARSLLGRYIPLVLGTLTEAAFESLESVLEKTLTQMALLIALTLFKREEDLLAFH